MGEGMHLPTETTQFTPQFQGSPKSSGWSLLIGGTLALLIAGGVSLQFFLAAPSQAATEAAGKATVGNTKPPVEVLARVGKEVIPFDMVADECVARYGKEILDDLINRMIIQQACESQSVVVTEEEVTAEITRISKRFNMDPTGWYQVLKAERNITPQQYRSSIIWPMLALKKLAGERVELTEDEINKAFVRNYGERIKARMIMVENRRRATEVWEKAHRDPENFDKYAQEFSVDQNSRALGGAVPPIPRYTGNADVETAAFKMKEGEVSGIIEISPGRYVILKCEGRTVPTVTDIGEVRETLYEELLETKTQTLVAKVFEELKTNARVDNYLTKTSTGPDRVGTKALPVSASKESLKR